MEIRLDGRSAIVTGGSKGLGLATATRFAEAGADVAILARRPDVLEEACGRIRERTRGQQVKGIVCDVAVAEAVQAAFAEAEGAFGKIDILVNNAGESRSGPFESVTDEMWQADIDQKLMAAVRMTRLVWPGMKERRWGRVLNVLSVAPRAPRPGNAPTGVTRAAGLALTKVLAGEGAPYNILVNALLTGSIVSDQIVRRHKARGGEVTLEQMIEDVGKTIPLKRMGQPEEFANVACFLASDAASYMTGSAIPVDGGKSPTI